MYFHFFGGLILVQTEHVTLCEDWRFSHISSPSLSSHWAYNCHQASAHCCYYIELLDLILNGQLRHCEISCLWLSCFWGSDVQTKTSHNKCAEAFELIQLNEVKQSNKKQNVITVFQKSQGRLRSSLSWNVTHTCLKLLKHVGSL